MSGVDDTSTLIQNVPTMFLSQLLDVLQSSPSNGQALIYNSTSKKWVNSSAVMASATSLVTPAGWQVKDDGSGNLGFYNPSSQEETYMDPYGRLIFLSATATIPAGTLNWFGLANSGTMLLNVPSSGEFAISTNDNYYFTFEANSGNILLGGAITQYNGVALVGNGVPAEFGGSASTPVAIPNSSTQLGTYTPPYDGLFLVVVCIMCTTTATLSSLTVTYTDISSAATATQTLATTVALTGGKAASYFALCPATTAAAITVLATASIGSTDLHGSVVIFGL